MRKSIFGFGIGCLMTLLVSTSVLAAVPEDKTPTAGSWIETEAGKYFIDESGNKKTGWIRSDNNWYYCDDNTGIMLRAALTPDNLVVGMTGKWNGQGVPEVVALMESSPENRTFGWHQNGRRWYFVKEDGKLIISAWGYIDGEYYYFDDKGLFVRQNRSPYDGFGTDKNGHWNGKPSQYPDSIYSSPPLLNENIIILPDYVSPLNTVGPSAVTTTVIDKDYPEFIAIMLESSNSYPFVTVGILNSSDTDITIFGKNSRFYNMGTGSAYDTSLKVIKENQGLVVSDSDIIKPGQSKGLIFNMNSAELHYDSSCEMRFGLEYNGKGYLCTVSDSSTECVPVESAGMSLDMFR